MLRIPAEADYDVVETPLARHGGGLPRKSLTRRGQPRSRSRRGRMPIRFTPAASKARAPSAPP